MIVKQTKINLQTRHSLNIKLNIDIAGGKIVRTTAIWPNGNSEKHAFFNTGTTILAEGLSVVDQPFAFQSEQF